ncbi:hypothetical protein FRC10_006004 [Ceratobasidium sp. 414]|nr:hypothetical protein FRC10_006004 [Ceratobasidium sp. 414]
MSNPVPHSTLAHAHNHQPAGLLEANRQHFDSQAHVHGYDANPTVQKLAKECSSAILKAVPFDEDKTVVMDYACGTGEPRIEIQEETNPHGSSGLLSRALAPHTRTLIGVDISSKSVDYYNECVANQGVSDDEMRAVCVELKERGTEGPDAFDGIEFDVVVCTNAYHHFDDVRVITKILTSYLKPGTGTLLVIDLIRSSTSESLHKDHGE